MNFSIIRAKKTMKCIHEKAFMERNGTIARAVFERDYLVSRKNPSANG